MADFCFCEDSQTLKQQILSLKTSQFKAVCKDDSGYIITQLNQQNSKRWYFLSAYWLCGDVLL